MLLTWPATAVPCFRRRIIGRPCIGRRGGVADSGIRDLAVDRNIGRRRAIAGPPAGTHLMPQEGADGEQQSRADNKGRSERCQVPEHCFLLLPCWWPGQGSHRVTLGRLPGLLRILTHQAGRTSVGGPLAELCI